MAEKYSDSKVSWFLGTAGFSYPHWIGNIYPRGTRSIERLAIYARHFNTVELNTTFHAIHAKKVVRRWATVTPPEFRFCVKMPREVTHGPLGFGYEHRGPTQTPPDYLLQTPTLETTRRFFNVMEELEDKLAVVLLQFSSGFTAARRATLTRFIDRLPRTRRLAIEFRHRSWWTQETTNLLRDRGISWAATDRSPQYGAGGVPSLHQREIYVRTIVPTTDFLYVRWLGQHGQFSDHHAELFDPIERLKWWHQRLQHIQRASPAIRDIYCLFDDDFAGHAPTTARRFAGCLGLPQPRQFAPASDQLALFGDQPICFV
jgi:uncharacterized protein YecE (DUF72 family)